VVCVEKRENDCVEGVRGLRIPFPGSSVRRCTPPKDDGRTKEKASSKDDGKKKKRKELP
jgi:hypothetical protein